RRHPDLRGSGPRPQVLARQPRIPRSRGADGQALREVGAAPAQAARIRGAARVSGTSKRGWRVGADVFSGTGGSVVPGEDQREDVSRVLEDLQVGFVVRELVLAGEGEALGQGQLEPEDVVQLFVPALESLGARRRQEDVRVLVLAKVHVEIPL